VFVNLGVLFHIKTKTQNAGNWKDKIGEISIGKFKMGSVRSGGLRHLKIPGCWIFLHTCYFAINKTIFRHQKTGFGIEINYNGIQEASKGL